jgi:hypothetical protein
MRSHQDRGANHRGSPVECFPASSGPVFSLRGLATQDRSLAVAPRAWQPGGKPRLPSWSPCTVVGRGPGSGFLSEIQRESALLWVPPLTWRGCGSCTREPTHRSAVNRRLRPATKCLVLRGPQGVPAAAKLRERSPKLQRWAAELPLRNAERTGSRRLSGSEQIGPSLRIFSPLASIRRGRAKSAVMRRVVPGEHRLSLHCTASRLSQETDHANR